MKIIFFFNCFMLVMEILNEYINNLLKFLKAKRKIDLLKVQYKFEVFELLIGVQLIYRVVNYYKFIKES